MTSYCYDCVFDLWGEVEAKMNDLLHDNSSPQLGFCDNCGPGLFDHWGKRVGDAPIDEKQDPLFYLSSEDELLADVTGVQHDN